MHTPRGLRKPHHIAEIIPPLLAFLGVATAAYFAFPHIAQTTTIP
jgi:hypothetical protein